MQMEFLFRTILEWGMSHPDELLEVCLGNAMRVLTAGNKYVSSTTHGGKSVAFSFPLTGPGRGAGINMETAVMLAQKAKWVISNYSTADIKTYLATYPSDMQVATWWNAANDPNASNP